MKIKEILKEHKFFSFSLIIISILVLIAVFAPLIAPYDPYVQNLKERLLSPSAKHLLGTDELGRDVLSRLIYGSRISLAVGLIPTFISMSIGTLLGLISGYYAGKVDFVIMRMADIMFAFPSLLFALVVMYITQGGLINIYIALSLINWAATARVVRSQTLSLKEKEYVLAAKTIGLSNLKIIFKHIFPNCLPSLIVLFTLNIPSAILSEASLSFLGVGARPPSASFGLMAVKGKKYLFSHPHLVLAPSLAIMIVVLLFNFLGDGIRDMLDPHLRDE